MAIDLSNLEFRFSGGASNSDISLSRGGVISSEEVVFKNYSTTTPFTGVTIVNSFGASNETDTLTYTNSTTSLKWKSTGEVVDVSSDGRYFLNENSANPPSTGLVVEIVAASLPGADDSDSITISNNIGNLYEQVTKNEKLTQATEYVGMYIINTHSTDSFLNFTLWSDAPSEDDAPSSTIAWHRMGLHPSGKNSTLEDILSGGDEYTEPTGITWVKNRTSGSALALPDLAAGDYIGIWLERQVFTTTPGNQTVVANFNFKVDF